MKKRFIKSGSEALPVRGFLQPVSAAFSHFTGSKGKSGKRLFQYIKIEADIPFLRFLLNGKGIPKRLDKSLSLLRMKISVERPYSCFPDAFRKAVRPLSAIQKEGRATLLLRIQSLPGRELGHSAIESLIHDKGSRLKIAQKQKRRNRIFSF